MADALKTTKKNQSPTDLIYELVSEIKPYDAQEQEQVAETQAWIKSGSPIFRIEKPNIPNKHLAAYFVMFDEHAQKILLVDHKNAQLWLPPGGHVEIDEDPKETVRRECLEELGVPADFWRAHPIFLTSTVSAATTGGHIDVTLWYIIKGNHQDAYVFDAQEFNRVRWFGFEEIPYQNAEPHLKRFIKKLQTIF